MMLFGMLAILTTWFLIIVVFCGVGLSILRLIRIESRNIESVLSSFWIGWSLTMTILQIWHLFAPVDKYSVLFVIVLGISGLIWNLNLVKEIYKGFTPNKLPIILFMGFFALWLANRAMGPINNYDTGLYHLNAIRWISAYAIIPGLGNLNDRLAFNSSYFLLFSFLDVGPWVNRSQHLGNGVLLLILSVQLGLSVVKTIVDRKNLSTRQIFETLLAIPIVYFCLLNASNTSTDLPVYVLGILIGSQLWKMLFSVGNQDDLFPDLFLIVILSLVGISIKLSFLALGLSSSIIAIIKYITDQRGNKSSRFVLRRLALILISFALILIPWMIRGVFLSGYVAYPSTFGGFNVDWRIPQEQAINSAKWIESWARQPHLLPDEVLSNWNWLKPWANNTIRDVFLVTVPLLFLIIGVFLYIARWKDHKNSRISETLILIPPITSLLFWFFTAPSPRFAGASFWWLGAGVLLLGGNKFGKLKYLQTVVSISQLAIILVLGIYVFWKGFVLPAGPDEGFYPIPAVQTHEFTTNSGLELIVPNVGDQCWEINLLCTPYPKTELRLISKREIQNGFTQKP